MLKPEPIPEIPAETTRVARAAFPKSNTIIRLRDEIGTIWTNQNFSALFPKRGQPGIDPWRLALVTIVQFLEHLTDRQAADAVRARIDLKYALSLPLDDSGFDRSVLSEFRARLIAGNAEHILLETLLEKLTQQGLVKAKGKQRTDSTHMITSVKAMNRLELITETMRAALNHIATIEPEWLRAFSQADWFDRYDHRASNYRLPKSAAARLELAEQTGTDGFCLLDALALDSTPSRLREAAISETLRVMWEQHFERKKSRVRFRPKEEVPLSSKRVCSPYDTDARYSSKPGIEWEGYKVHFTETCDQDVPHLIVNRPPAKVG